MKNLLMLLVCLPIVACGYGKQASVDTASSLRSFDKDDNCPLFRLPLNIAVKQKLFSWGGVYRIFDEDESIIAKIEQRQFSRIEAVEPLK